MPIEVHCPNPVCAHVHLVKNRYAGMRGKCPVCSSWMYVPVGLQMPSMILDRPEGLEEAATWKQDAKAKKPAKKADAEPLVELVEEEEAAPEKSTRRINRLATVLVVLGMFALGAVIAAPYLTKPSIQASGEFVNDIGQQEMKGIEAENLFYLPVLPACLIGGAVLCLIATLVARQFAFPSLLLLYLTTIGSALLLLLALTYYRGETRTMEKLTKAIADRKQSGKSQGDATVDKGQQLYALAGGALAACVCFILAGVVAHRKWWSRILCLLFLGLFVAVAMGYVYQNELGIAEYIPREVKDLLPI
jgi:hypothetical protein